MSEGDVGVYHRLSSTRQLLRIDTSWSYFLQAFWKEAILVCVYGPIRALATNELHGHDLCETFGQIEDPIQKVAELADQVVRNGIQQVGIGSEPRSNPFLFSLDVRKYFWSNLFNFKFPYKHVFF